MVPPRGHPVWQKVVTGQLNFRPSFVAAQMMMARVTRSVRGDPSPANINKCIGDMHTFFVKYESEAASDLARLV